MEIDRKKSRKFTDYRYGNETVGLLINMIMQGGKKSLAQKIVYDAFDIMKEKSNDSELEVFQAAVANVRPRVEVKSRRVGGATYQVPVEVDKNRGTTLALRWIVNFARDKSGTPMSNRLAFEILDAYNQEGNAVRKKKTIHKMAEANKAFAHYRW